MAAKRIWPGAIASGEPRLATVRMASTHEPATARAQQIAQIAGALGKLPHQPDDHHLLEVGAIFRASPANRSSRSRCSRTTDSKPSTSHCIGPGLRTPPACRIAGMASQQQHKPENARHIAQRLAQIERILPRNRKDKEQQQAPGNAVASLEPLRVNQTRIDADAGSGLNHRLQGPVP